MKVFNNLEEMKPYYNEETNTYEFIENGNLIDVKIDFGLNIECNINAHDIKARDIKARNINADDIKAWDINASEDIEAIDIKAHDIKARDINACGNIKAKYIIARDISAENINVNKILFNAVCFAYETFVCNSIKGTRPNSKYFCLDSEIVIKGDKKNVK